MRIRTLEGLDGRPVTGEADPQAAVLAKLVGLKTQQVPFGLTIFVRSCLRSGPAAILLGGFGKTVGIAMSALGSLLLDHLTAQKASL